MDFLSDTDRNPFGMDPPCERAVPGYGDTGADFQVIGDSPAVHGGTETGLPFADRPWSGAFFDALAAAGMVEDVDLDAGRATLDETFLSYLCMCDTGEEPPTEGEYDRLEPYFDSELRAITAHVLVPVGERAISHVLGEYTARSVTELDEESLHATEIRGSGWLVVPVKEPARWGEGDADALVRTLVELRERDYRMTADLGRFFPGEESYLVR